MRYEPLVRAGGRGARAVVSLPAWAASSAELLVNDQIGSAFFTYD
jgi:hypothetical protein